MQYKADTPDEYLKKIDADWRKERLMAIREMMLAANATEALGYGMLRYVIDGGVLAHMNAQKHYVGVYLGELERIDPGAAIRGKMDCGKTCLRIKKSSDLDVVQKLITRKIEAGLPPLDEAG